MPSSKFLEWADIPDFTPGYFSVGDWLIPASGAQEMLDCRPDPGGGLRASAKPTTFSTSGIPSTARVVGIYTRGAIALQSGAATDTSDRYLAVYDTADNKVKIYRWNQTTTSVATSWTLIKAHAAVNATPNPVQFDTFIDSGGAAHVVWTLAHTSSDDGLWSLQFSYQAGQGASAVDDLGVTATRSVTQRVVGFVTAVGVQDDRIVVAKGARFTTIYWNASQDITSWPAPNNLPVQASRQGAIVVSITPFAPGDLLLGCRFGAWIMVQGSITDPIVRTQSDARTLQAGQRVPFTTQGLAFVSPKMGVFLTSSGESFEDASTQIDPHTFINSALVGDTGAGEMAYVGNLLLAPHGLFRDERTQSWHRSSVLTTSKQHFHSWSDQNNREFFVATGDVNFALWIFSADETANRWHTYTWKSASFRHPTGRQIRIREVEIYCKAYDTSSSVAVTVNGTTRTVVMTAAGRQQLDFLFDEYDEVLDVQVVSSAGSSSVEAPSIEVVRVGTKPQHRLR